MFKLVTIVLAILMPITAMADLSDNDAKRIAVNMEASVAKAKATLNQLIATGSRNQYPGLRSTVSSTLNDWPAQNLGNRAAFPYFSCAQAARDLLQYGDAWNRNEQKNEWIDHMTKKFRESEAGCSAAIKKPDMSLKDIS